MRPGAMRLGLLLRQAHRAAAQSLETALAPLGVGSRHFGVLLLLERDGASNQRDLVAQTGGDKASMQRTITELESKGLIHRQADSNDRRLINLTLTEAGRTLFRQALLLTSPVGDALTTDLDDDELEQLISLLERIAH